MRPFHHSLACRMAALILLGTGLVLVLVLAFGYVSQRRRILADSVREGDTLAQSVIFQIEAPLGRAESTIRQTALILADRDLTRTESAHLIRATLENHCSLFGMAIALTAKTAAESDFRILYGWRENDSIHVEDRPNPLQDYQQDWFNLPAELAKPVWVEPYFDIQSQTTMVTYSVPILRGDEVTAVVTCDVSLDDLDALLGGLPVGENGIAVLLSKRGTFIVHPDSSLEMRETIYSLAESQADEEETRVLTVLGDMMLSGSPGHLRYRRPFGDMIAYLHSCPVPCTGWALGIIRPEESVLAPLRRLNRISILVAVASLALLLIPAMGIAWSVTHPLRRLAVASNQMAAGDFDTALPLSSSRDEVAQLTESFERMRQELRRYIADLTATTAAKERIAGELSAAREIQLSIVPKLFPPFPDRADIDLYALLIPALEVGGDLYDFVLLDQDHLYVAVGDVSGKGVPASLLMAVGKTLLKSTIQSVCAPARALAHVNNEIAEDNESCMFITMFCGILNLKTGDFIYANAGHNPPLLLRNGGEAEWLDDTPNPPLGACPGVNYQVRSKRLYTGDLLVVYTDGVTEAMSPEYAMFGEDGLKEYICSHENMTAKELMLGLGEAVRAHANGAAQSDDITGLAVRFRAPGSEDEAGKGLGQGDSQSPDAVLTLQNNLREITRLAEWIDTRGDDVGIPVPLRTNINLVLEEWVVNVISYAYTDKADHVIELRFWGDEANLTIEVEDDGRPFDPTAQAEADISMPLEHRPIGGLGIYFIRKTMDSFAYRRENDHNIVTMSIKTGAQAS